jgi:putative tryptophan/tyrosine transport system substrate-binding protein
MMRRRELIAGIGGAVAWPVVARAQQPALPVIGFLHPTLETIFPERIAAFRAGLAELGYIEGQNVVIDYRRAKGRNYQLTALATDLVRHRVSVIAAPNTATALAAKAATRSIPIVFILGGDPVASGVVASLNRPRLAATSRAFRFSQAS